MLSRFWPKLVVASFALIFSVAAIQTWRADRRDRAHLAAELAATKQLLVAADARQRDRDAHLAQTLSALDAQKRAILTPAQIVNKLARDIPLPAPLALQQDSTPSVRTRFSPPARLGASPTSSAPEKATQASPSPNVGDAQTSGGSLPLRAAPALAGTQKPAPDAAVIPRADLKPLYDFTLDCQACQAKLSAAQNDLVDEKTKTAALTKERDDALRIAKGGSAWRRFGRAAKWLAIGAAVGAVVAKAH